MSGHDNERTNAPGMDEQTRQRLLAETEAQIREHPAYRFAEERLKAEARMDLARVSRSSTPNAEEIRLCREQAEAGDHEAMCRLADMYRGGDQENMEARLHWMHRAAEAGNARAAFFLARRHDYPGSILKRREDQVKAVEWYVRAAELGRPDAMNRLGWLYLFGQSVERDDSKAMEWFRRAAEAGHVNAMDVLASGYERGVGVTPDYDKALAWYRRAAQCGHNGALKRLRKLGELV